VVVGLITDGRAPLTPGAPLVVMLSIVAALVAARKSLAVLNGAGMPGSTLTGGALTGGALTGGYRVTTAGRAAPLPARHPHALTRSR
jgi:hypothetical protein